MKYLSLLFFLFVFSFSANAEIGLPIVQHPESIVVSHHVNEFVEVDFLTSLDSYKAPEIWGGNE